VAPPPAASPAPPAPVSVATPPVAAAAPGQPQVQYVYVKRGQPGWLVALLVALALVGAGAAAYYFLFPSLRGERAADEPEITMETPKQGAAGEAPQAVRLAKFLEVTGLRIVEENKRPQLRYIVVNHSGADLAAIKGSVVLRASNAAEGAPPIATVPLDLASLGPYEVREFITTLKTNLRAYELPDWQFLRADLRITGQ
jgi:hypothetical protein